MHSSLRCGRTRDPRTPPRPRRPPHTRRCHRGHPLRLRRRPRRRRRGRVPARRHRGRLLPPLGPQAGPGRRHGAGRAARSTAHCSPSTAASHSGEERHLAGARRILELAGLTEDDLRNVPDLPYDPAVRDAWVREGRQPSRLAQNCSGKHAAMLYTCKLNGWPLESYLDPGHPLQQAIAEIVEDLTGQRIAQVTVDGCGAPLFSVSLHGLARAARPHHHRRARTPPRRRVADAMRDARRDGVRRRAGRGRS